MSELNFDPLEDRVIVRPDPKAEATEEAPKNRRTSLGGVVVAVGPGREINGQRWPMKISVGDSVVFDELAGTEVEFGGSPYLVLSEREILARSSPAD